MSRGIVQAPNKVFAKWAARDVLGSSSAKSV